MNDHSPIANDPGTCAAGTNSESVDAAASPESKQPEGTPAGPFVGADARKLAEFLLQGKLHAHVETPSILFFTVHKSASAYVASLLTRMARSEQLIPVDVESYLYAYTDEALRNHVSPELYDYYCGNVMAPSAQVIDEVQRLFPSRGFYYGALRTGTFFSRLPHLDEFKTVLMLRDPRDVLTSLYFSMAFGHVLPDGDQRVLEKFKRSRNTARRLQLDDYVIACIPTFRDIYSGYFRTLIDRPSVFLTTYEEMVRDFPTWLKGMLDYCGLDSDSPVAHQLIREADFSVKKEDPYSHKRQVQPGDHKRKLKPETIETLNVAFADVIERMGYGNTSSSGKDAA